MVIKKPFCKPVDVVGLTSQTRHVVSRGEGSDSYSGGGGVTEQYDIRILTAKSLAPANKVSGDPDPDQNVHVTDVINS